MHIGVHGYRYDPADPDHDPHELLYPQWEKIFSCCFWGYGWYSVPFGFKNLMRAWGAGHWNTYRYAWDLSTAAGDALAEHIEQQTEPVSIVAHSLGTRVVLDALSRIEPDAVNSVLLLNGADIQEHARPVARHTDAHLVNIVIKSDDVLRHLGRRFIPGSGKCIGQSGFGFDADDTPDNLTEIVIDDEDTQLFAFSRRGWQLEGDNPKRMTDHHYSYRNKNNWPLYQAWAAGDPLEEFRRLGRHVI